MYNLSECETTGGFLYSFRGFFFKTSRGLLVWQMFLICQIPCWWTRSWRTNRRIWRAGTVTTAIRQEQELHSVYSLNFLTVFVNTQILKSKMYSHFSHLTHRTKSQVTLYSIIKWTVYIRAKFWRMLFYLQQRRPDRKTIHAPPF